jgi:hypothetical protein
MGDLRYTNTWYEMVDDWLVGRSSQIGMINSLSDILNVSQTSIRLQIRITMSWLHVSCQDICTQGEMSK